MSCVLYPALRPYTDETTLFGAGLVLLAAAGIMTAITVWRDRGLMAWGGVLGVPAPRSAPY